MKIQDNQNRFLPLNRRSFIVLSGLLGIGTASGAIFASSSEVEKYDKDRFKVSKTLPKIGTIVSITLIHSSRNQAEEAIGRAFEEIDRLEGLFNRYNTSTAVASLNHHGKLKQIPPEIQDVISKSLYYNRLSGGPFDITIKPVIDLFREKLGDGGRWESMEIDISEALDLVGSEKIELRGGTLRFGQEGMGITLDGIAKGYIVDKASRVLADIGGVDHLINAGGDIRTMGAKPGKRPWTIAIQDPEKKKNYPDLIQMKDGAIATSGNYEVFYDREKMFHHIVDPRTGRCPALNSSVSVVAKTTMDADALSTSVFVMDPPNGKAFINNLPDCECLIVTREKRHYRSNGWRGASA